MLQRVECPLCHFLECLRPPAGPGSGECRRPSPACEKSRECSQPAASLLTREAAAGREETDALPLGHAGNQGWAGREAFSNSQNLKNYAVPQGGHSQLSQEGPGGPLRPTGQLKQTVGVFTPDPVPFPLCGSAAQCTPSWFLDTVTSPLPSGSGQSRLFGCVGVCGGTGVLGCAYKIFWICSL